MPQLIIIVIKRRFKPNAHLPLLFSRSESWSCRPFQMSSLPFQTGGDYVDGEDYVGHLGTFFHQVQFMKMRMITIRFIIWTEENKMLAVSFLTCITLTGRDTRLLQRSDATSLEGHKSFRPLLPHIWGDTAFPYMSSSLQVWCIKMFRTQYSMDLASSWSGESTRGGWASFWAGGLAGVLSWQVSPVPPKKCP